MTPEEFQDFANGQSNGYLKHWKAMSILGTLAAIPDIENDPIRLRKYLKNCLEMEGFLEQGIENIATEIERRKQND